MNERAYKCWFEFLRRSERYKQCCLRRGTGELVELYADFGDVHAHGLLWSDWWITHQNLFSEIEPLFVVNEVQTKVEFDWLFEDDQDDLLALIINLNAPKETILNEVESIVARLQLEQRRQENALILKANPKAKVTERFGRPKHDLSFYHRYGLATAPNDRDCFALEKMLEVYDEFAKNEIKQPSDRRTASEIAEYLGIMVMPSENTKKEYGTASAGQENIQRGQSVRRYYKWANEIIENVERGIFPKHN